MAGRVEYEPISVKDLLVEMKDTAELLIDLAYSAVLHQSDAVAEEVLELEEQMDLLQIRARMSLLLAARSPEEAETLAPVLGIIGAAEKVSDAAGDIAKVVLEDIGVPDNIQGSLPEALEILVRAELDADSSYANKTLSEINMETELGVRVIAIRRGGSWVLNPDAMTILRPDDILLLRGPRPGIETVFETASGEEFERVETPDSGIDDLERAVDSLVLMKNMSELAVDLSYGSVLFDSDELAEEVVELEMEVDQLKSRFEAWILQAAARVEDPVRLRGLVHIATSTEVISDAAVEISEGVLRGLDTHVVVQEAVEESDEIIVRVTVTDGSTLDGSTLGQQDVKSTTGMRVIAVRHPDEEDTEWTIQPGPNTDIMAGDVLLAKGTRSGADILRDLAGDTREV
ncbi:MAG: potassium channel family protein [Halodesulfurarchaeum sp.]